MLQSQFSRLQPIISTLFDTPSITLSPSTTPTQILSLTIQYARKLIQITQKIDQFRSRTANSHQAQVYSSILKLFIECGYREEEQLSEIEMLEMIMEDVRRKSEFVKESLKENKERKIASRSQTKRSKKDDIGKKEMAIVRDGFKKEEISWKDIYSKIDNISQRHLNQKRFIVENIIQQQVLSFPDLVKQNITFTSYHLSNISKFLDSLIQHLPNAKNNKLIQLLSEIEQRQNVFSYSISRLMQAIRTLKNPTNRNPEQTYESITTLISKLFDIYPNAQLLKSLDLKQDNRKYNPNIKQYLNNCKETQCNIRVQSKKEIELKNLSLSFYRYRVRVQQGVKKLEGSMKWKKVEGKEGEKWMEEIREAVHWGENEGYEEIRSFEQELQKITGTYEKKEVEIKEQYTKQIKKAQKSLQSYQSQLKLLKTQLSTYESTSQKVSKKLQLQKLQKQKLKQKITQLTKIIDTLQLQLQKSKSSLKSQHKQQLRQQKLLKSQFDNILKQKKQHEQQLNILIQKLKQSQRLFEQERGSFIAKVKMMQNKYQHVLYENTETKQCLEQMIQDNKILKDKLEEFVGIHEDKIRECEEVGNEYQQMENQLNHHKAEIKDSRITLESSKSLILDLEKQLIQATQTIQKFVKQKQSILNQCYRYKQLDKLNQGDVEQLKIQFEKVYKSYRDVESENIYLKQNLDEMVMEHNKVIEIQERCNFTISQLEYEIKRLKKDILEHEQQNKFLRQQVKLKENHFTQLLSTAQLSKQSSKQLPRLKRQLTQLRNSLTTSQLQYNVAKQELQNMIQEQESKKSMERGQVKAVSARLGLEIESLKMEVKSGKEGWEKEKKGWERERGILGQKIEELERLVQEKDGLSNRIKGFRL